MSGFTIPDYAAFALFVAAWAVYHFTIESGYGGGGLNHLMNGYRVQWMQEMAERDVRIVDSAIMGTLQNGTAFFASTSLLAIGGVATMLRATDDFLRVFSELSVGLTPDRSVWELKVVGLLLIFGYAFFKFAWAYRLFNYAAILIGATPARNAPDREARDRMALRAARMNKVAGTQFTRGQRAFFFALAYMGWFLGPYFFMATTAVVLFAMWRRQFASGARKALLDMPMDDRG